MGPLVLENMSLCVRMCVCISEKDVIYTCMGQKEEGAPGVHSSTWPIIFDHISFFFLSLLLKRHLSNNFVITTTSKSCLNTSEEKTFPIQPSVPLFGE